MRDLGNQRDSSGLDGDPLDALLRQAKWPVAGEERVERLARSWHAVWDGRSRRESLRNRGWAVAAVVMVGLGVAWIVGRGEPQRAEPQATSPSLKEMPNFADARPKEAPLVGREPNLYERAVVTAWRQSERRRTDFVRDERVEAAIDRLRYEPDVSLAQAARPLMGAKRAYYERRLIENARYFDGPRRRAALELLAVVGTPRSVQDLIDLVRRDADREIAAAALVRVAAPGVLGRWLQSEPDATARRGVLAALLGRQDGNAVRAFLGYVLVPALSDDALAAVDQCRHLPLDALFAELRSSSKAHALAAARVLGKADDPRVVSRLARMVQVEPNSAAMAALLCSDAPQAAQWVAKARKTWPLVTAVQEAQTELSLCFQGTAKASL